MLYILIYLFICIFLCYAISVFNIFTFSLPLDKEKSAPFECGFEPHGRARLSFCIKFFLVGVIFLIFDVEVRLLLPLPFRPLIILFFIFFLLLGLIYE